MSKLEEFAKFLGVEGDLTQVSKIAWDKSFLKEEIQKKGFLPSNVTGIEDIVDVSFSYVADNTIEITVRCFPYARYETVAEGVYIRRWNIDFQIRFDYTKVKFDSIYISNLKKK